MNCTGHRGPKPSQVITVLIFLLLFLRDHALDQLAYKAEVLPLPQIRALCILFAPCFAHWANRIQDQRDLCSKQGTRCGGSGDALRTIYHGPQLIVIDGKGSLLLLPQVEDAGNQRWKRQHVVCTILSAETAKNEDGQGRNLRSGVMRGPPKALIPTRCFLHAPP